MVTDDPLMAAVDALVAAGFKADGDSLAWLAAEVKKRTDEPVAKKSRVRGLQGELEALGPAIVPVNKEARGGAARVNERGRGR